MCQYGYITLFFNDIPVLLAVNYRLNAKRIYLHKLSYDFSEYNIFFGIPLLIGSGI